MADTDPQTNAQALWTNFVNRIGALVGPAQPAGVLSGAATAGGIPPAVPTAAVAPITAPTPRAAQPAAPAASVPQQLATQDATRQAAAQNFVASLPNYTPAANAVQPAPRAGGGSAPVPAAAGNGRFTDPANAIQTGYNQQVGYAQTMADIIQHLASAGDPRNYSFRLAHLGNALTGGNFGAVQGQGIDALNNAIAGITSAGIYGGAQMYGANQQLADTQAQVAGNLALEAGRTQPIGMEPVNTAYGPIPMTTYGVVSRTPGGMVSVNPVGPSAERRTQVPAGTKVKQPDGTYTLQNGQTVTVKNGTVQ